MDPEIWAWVDGTYKVHVQNIHKKAKIARWKDCEVQNWYHLPNGVKGWDIKFPKELYNQIARLMDLPQKKGKQFGKRK